MLIDQEKNKLTNKREEGPDIQQEWRTIGGPNAAQSGNQGEGRDQEDGHAEDG